MKIVPSKLLTDSTTEARLGGEVLAEVRADLWPVACQTCGRSFGRWEKPALTVQAVADTADASLHHRSCRPPRWLEYPAGVEAELSTFPHVTWRAMLFLLPTGPTPVFLVNPYYEFAMLRRDSGRWRVATLDRFASAGMGPDMFDGVIAQPSLSVVVDEDGVSAHITDDAAIEHSWHVSPISPDIREVIDTREWITIGVTTSLDLRRRERDNPLPALIAARQVRLGAARIAYTERAQQLRESDFDDEARVQMLTLTSKAIEIALGIEVGNDQLTAAVACGHGDNVLITQLKGRDKLLAALLVAVPYAVRSRARPPAPGGGVHVMAADPAGVAECFEMFTALTESTGNTVVRLATDPTAEQRRTEYLADIVIGMPEQFRAAYTFYRDDADDWGLHETRGHLAMTIGVDVRHRADELIRRYPKVAVI